MTRSSMHQISDTDVIGTTPLSNLHLLVWSSAVPRRHIERPEMLQCRGAAWRN